MSLTKESAALLLVRKRFFFAAVTQGWQNIASILSS